LSVLGLGTDLVEVARVADVAARHGDRFLQRCFRPDEIAYVASRGPRAGTASLAARWAAKEACLKALGAAAPAIPYRDIEVVRGAGGAVGLKLHGRAARALDELGGRRLLLSLTHDAGLAAATVIIEG